MSLTLLSKVETSTGDVIVMTKTRYLLFLPLPRTSVMPWSASELGRTGVQFQWSTKNGEELRRLHALVVETIEQGISLADLRYVADVGKQLLSIGLPFVPADSPVPQSLKQIGKHLRRVV